eukprot:160165-Chlamydomonas_euryale.AAC.1
MRPPRAAPQGPGPDQAVAARRSSAEAPGAHARQRAAAHAHRTPPPGAPKSKRCRRTRRLAADC